MKDPELLELVELEVRELLQSYGSPEHQVQIIRGSPFRAVEGDVKEERAIERLLDVIAGHTRVSEQEVDTPFVMAITDVEWVSGRTLVTGLVERGTVRAGQEVEIVGFAPTMRNVVIEVDRTIEVDRDNRPRQQVVTANHIKVSIGETEKGSVKPGQVLAKPASITAHRRFRGEVYILTKEEEGRHTPFFNGYRPQFYLHTTDVTGTVKLPLGVDMVRPGDNVQIEVELFTPVALEDRQRFRIREGGRTVGVGIITEIII